MRQLSPAAFLLLGLIAVTQTVNAADLPNILWISCEDICPDLGCYGDNYAYTPNIDKLAREGIRYTHAFSVSGVCAPSR
ncbi:MAG: sulfatase-like hydrolase/transferase [Phycisphaerae bacterium]